MKKRMVSTLSVRAAAIAVLLVGTAARAGSCISIQWIAIPCCYGCNGYYCCKCPAPPDPLDCCSFDSTPALLPFESTGAAPCSANWNIAPTQGGVFPNLIQEKDGERVMTSATVLWAATNTSSSTDDILFTGSDLKLMSAYLDQNTLIPFPTSIVIIDLPDDLARNYDVYIYTLTNVPNFGGEYFVNDQGPKFVLAGGNGVFNGPNFVKAEGNDPNFGENDWGNYVVFQNLSGNTVAITAINTVGGKAPVNGVQIVKSGP